MKQVTKCCELIFGDHTPPNQCRGRGRYEHEGKYYCAIHHPGKKAERKKKQINCAWKGGCDTRVSKPGQLCSYHRDNWLFNGAARERTTQLEGALKALISTAENVACLSAAVEAAQVALDNPPRATRATRAK